MSWLSKTVRRITGTVQNVAKKVEQVTGFANLNTSVNFPTSADQIKKQAITVATVSAVAPGPGIGSAVPGYSAVSKPLGTAASAAVAGTVIARTFGTGKSQAQQDNAGVLAGMTDYSRLANSPLDPSMYYNTSAGGISGSGNPSDQSFLSSLGSNLSSPTGMMWLIGLGLALVFIAMMVKR